MSINTNYTENLSNNYTLSRSEKAIHALASSINTRYEDIEKAAETLSADFANLLPGDYALLLSRIQKDQHMIEMLTAIAKVLSDVRSNATKTFVLALENRPYIYPRT